MGLPDVYGEDTETAQQVQAMLDIMPEGTRSSLDMHLRQAAKKELSKEAKEALADQAQNVSQRLTGMREQLVKQEQTCETPVTIEFYHCDHLGTPIALTNEQHQVVWAARLDPWGNVQEEFNPSGMDQAIRLPGQHHDRETGLYYNRHRYYDPGIGSYVNQDPIGLAGGVNNLNYTLNPNMGADPLGLSPTAGPSKPIDIDKVSGRWDKITGIFNWNENVTYGGEVKLKSAQLACTRAEERKKRADEDRQNLQEDGAAVVRDVMAVEVSEVAQLDFGLNSVGKVYGYFSKTPPICPINIGQSSTNPAIDFFKK